MPKLSVGDADLYYEIHGEGPPLFLVPGLGGVGAFWASQVVELARHFRVITHDHRGCGQSSLSRIAYSVEQMAEDLRRLMDALGIETAHLVGHSTGGAIGQILAQDRPERIGRLVLSASWGGRDAYFRRCFESRKAALQAGGIRGYWRQSVLMQRPPAWISANEAALLDEEAQTLAHPPDEEILLSRIDAIIGFDRRARLGDIGSPTLVVVAADDLVTPPYLSEELAAKIPNARLDVMPYGGHFAPVIEPAVYNAVVGAFLRQA